MSTYGRISASVSVSGMTFVAKRPTDDLIHKYQETLSKTVEVLEGFVFALAAINQKDYEWWSIIKRRLDEDEVLGSSDADITSCFTTSPSMK